MNIPLINSNSKQDINTSLIAIRNAINELSRMKESASVEDLQRQINIINQQIVNFNSEFSAINTHLNTIDTNILNLQPVDTVASGNLHSVTSNAVANSLNGKMNTAYYTDVDLDTLTTFGIYQVHSSARTWSDLHFPISAWGVLIVARPNGDWINQIFIPDYEPIMYQRTIYSPTSIVNRWEAVSTIVLVHVTLTTDGDGNANTGYNTSGVWIPTMFIPSSVNTNYPTIITCDAYGAFYLKLFRWGSFTPVPNVSIEGDLYLQRKS